MGRKQGERDHRKWQSWKGKDRKMERVVERGRGGNGRMEVCRLLSTFPTGCRPRQEMAAIIETNWRVFSLSQRASGDEVEREPHTHTHFHRYAMHGYLRIKCSDPLPSKILYSLWDRAALPLSSSLSSFISLYSTAGSQRAKGGGREERRRRGIKKKIE